MKQISPCCSLCGTYSWFGTLRRGGRVRHLQPDPFPKLIGFHDWGVVPPPPTNPSLDLALRGAFFSCPWRPSAGSVRVRALLGSKPARPSHQRNAGIAKKPESVAYIHFSVSYPGPAYREGLFKAPNTAACLTWAAACFLSALTSYFTAYSTGTLHFINH